MLAASSSVPGARCAYRVVTLRCIGAGFSEVLLRGDNDFSQTTHLDGWEKAGYRFVFGMDAKKNLNGLAGAIPNDVWPQLLRDILDLDIDDEREQKVRFREQIVEKKGYENIRLVAEDYSDVPYKPNACESPYRLVIVRKTLESTEVLAVASSLLAVHYQPVRFLERKRLGISSKNRGEVFERRRRLGADGPLGEERFPQCGAAKEVVKDFMPKSKGDFSSAGNALKYSHGTKNQ